MSCRMVSQDSGGGTFALTDSVFPKRRQTMQIAVYRCRNIWSPIIRGLCICALHNLATTLKKSHVPGVQAHHQDKGNQ